MKTAVLICPGRGTYNKTELGVLKRHFPSADLLAAFDVAREAQGQTRLSALDSAMTFETAVHTRGDNASGLIFAASFGDFLAIDDGRIDLVAVTGNSMGWYSALACAGAVTPEAGFDIVNTMGRWMHEDGVGGQVVYPFTDDNWRAEPDAKEALLEQVVVINKRPDHSLSLSIDLGGILVLAGNEPGLAAFRESVPKRDLFPMTLAGHAAFHSELVTPISKRALEHFTQSIFSQPDLPMIDGRGAIWWPGACDPQALRSYTFGHQVTEPYDFTRAVTVAAREFAPDLFIVAGPGTTLNGVVAQSLVLANWRGMTSKGDFQSIQASESFLVSMGRDDQRRIVSQGRYGHTFSPPEL